MKLTQKDLDNLGENGLQCIEAAIAKARQNRTAWPTRIAVTVEIPYDTKEIFHEPKTACNRVQELINSHLLDCATKRGKGVDSYWRTFNVTCRIERFQPTELMTVNAEGEIVLLDDEQRPDASEEG